MTSVPDANVYNVSVEGTFDNCQSVVKALFSDQEFRKEYRLAAVNSINWARILSQVVYYFYSYFRMQEIHPGMVDMHSRRKRRKDPILCSFRQLWRHFGGILCRSHESSHS